MVNSQNSRILQFGKFLERVWFLYNHLFVFAQISRIIDPFRGTQPG